MAEKVDWHAMWQDERAEVKRLTDALIQAKTYGTLPKPPATPSDPLAPPGLPKRVEANLEGGKARLRGLNPGAPEEDIESEARRLAGSFLTDA